MCLTVARNVLWLDNSGKAVHSCVTMATINGFRLTATSRSTTIQVEGIVTFPWQQWLRERATFLGTFAELRKATISFVMSVRPRVRMEQLGSRWTDFHEIFVF